MKRLLSAVGLALLCAHTAAAQSNTSDLDVSAPDGAKLRATYYSPGKAGPAMLLLHQCNMDRKSWMSFASALAQRGVHALAFDYRGYGESPRPGNSGMLAADVDAALATLKAQRGVDQQRIGVAGASCGVNNSIQLARRSGEMKALVLLSGPTTPDGLAYLREHPSNPIFALASSSEQFAVSALQAMTATSTNKATTLRVTDKPGHGTPLFSAEPELLTTVVAWVGTVLR